MDFTKQLSTSYVNTAEETPTIQFKALLDSLSRFDTKELWVAQTTRNPLLHPSYCDPIVLFLHF